MVFFKTAKQTFQNNEKTWFSSWKFETQRCSWPPKKTKLQIPWDSPPPNAFLAKPAARPCQIQEFVEVHVLVVPNIAPDWKMDPLKMSFLWKMGIFQPAMLGTTRGSIFQTVPWTYRSKPSTVTTRVIVSGGFILIILHLPVGGGVHPIDTFEAGKRNGKV